jgi:trehalose 6-phosphate synthase
LRGDRRGGADDFRPTLSDLREWVDRLAAETDAHGGVWDPARLRQTLRRYLQGERVVLVANREPYIHHRGDDGQVRVLHPASGLVTALEPVMRACSGVWVAHGAGNADRASSDSRGRVDVPPEAPSYRLRRVWLSRQEEDGYYYGFSNEGLWPLCHIAHARPAFRRSDWEWYQKVNERFANAVLEEVDSDDPIVLVQDYHFALQPRMIRERLPRATILTFWHIPWPNAERLGICPWAPELLEGLLGSSIVGFHTQRHCNNFLDSVDRFLETRIDREQQGVVYRGRLTLVRPYPISIEWPNHWAAAAPAVAECRAGVRAELGLAPDALLGVGVDRLDYTKGIEERLQAVQKLLEHTPRLRGRFTFVQVAAPSRTRIERYQELDRTVEALTARINARFGNRQWKPIVLLRQHQEPPAVFRYYRAADLCYVSSLDDGMNLVAKEFVAARDDRNGVLILSSFAGAARELTGALVVNPYDIDQASAALLSALTMSNEEKTARMESMRHLVAEFNVYRWAGRMVADAARARQRDRLSGRFAGYDRRPEAVGSRG